MYGTFQKHLATELAGIEEAGLTKHERGIRGPQRAEITADGAEVLNFCANNYLGLADDPRILDAATTALQEWGYGLASVRFICGTQEQHLELERRLSGFLGTDDAILYSSCFDANGGVFETLFGAEDAIISDELNHASIIDGIRLSKARRLRYRNRDMADLEEQLRSAADARFRVVVTDGVFSMDGYIAPLAEICDLAERYDALVFVDDSHAVGFVGENGRGTPELCGVADRVDIYTGTFGKALGGASGGYVASHRDVVALLRQRSRPYLFSNTLAPAIVAGTLTALDLVEGSADLRAQLRRNAALFRERMAAEGFDLLPGEHPIVPVMFGDASLTARIAREMQAQGVYVTAFSFPVVPRGAARIRVQLSAAHTAGQIERCVAAFVAARATVGVIPTRVAKKHLQRISCKGIFASVEDDTQVRKLDSSALKALAHPLRVQIFDLLAARGPQTASSLAALVGETSGSTSYHLRALAAHDFIQEVEGRGTARERWWERPKGRIDSSRARRGHVTRESCRRSDRDFGVLPSPPRDPHGVPQPAAVGGAGGVARRRPHDDDPPRHDRSPGGGAARGTGGDRRERDRALPRPDRTRCAPRVAARRDLRPSDGGQPPHKP